MPLGERLDDDDVVISILERDAAASTTNGGTGLLSSGRSKAREAPKPNTRFLKSLIRDTDSHNAALKAREEEESKQRLREFQREDRLGKRRREDDGGGRDHKRAKGGERQGRWASALAGLGGAGNGAAKRQSGDAGKHPARRRDCSREHDHRDDHHDERNRKRRDRRRSRSPDYRKQRRRRSRASSEEPRPSRLPSAMHRLTPPPSQRLEGKMRDSSDSDPLETVIGPAVAPIVKAWGRGAFKRSNIDSRFASDYNPKTDVAVDHSTEQDDWDMALEALRDRAKWQAQGASRLKAAGFTDDEVKRWEKGGELDIDNVKWRKKGEAREWDKGKVVEEDGSVELKAGWTK